MTWAPEIDKSRTPIYSAICEALAADISSGKLRPADKLPAHRTLAYRLGVTPGTVARAYGLAAKRGLVVGEVGRGTFVNDFGRNRGKITRLVVEESWPKNVVDLGLNLSAVGPSENLLRRTLKELSRSSVVNDLLNYQPAAGMPAHRATVCTFIKRHGLDCSPENVVMTGGGQHGLLLSMMEVAHSGETVLTEALTYPGVKAIAHQLGVNLVGVDIDENGLIPECLEQLCRTKSPKALYCMPVLQNPTTITLAEQRLRDIAQIAKKYDVWIIEDDVYGFLAESRALPISAIVPERCIYLSSFSKSLAPGLRVGFLVAPTTITPTLQELATMTNWMSAPLTAEIAMRWIADGEAESLVGWHRQQARDRQQVAHKALGDFARSTSNLCYHLWLNLPEQWRMDSFSAEALSRGVRVITADAFAVRRDQAPHAVRLCLGANHSLQEIKAATTTLMTLLQSRPRPKMDLQMVAHTTRLAG